MSKVTTTYDNTLKEKIFIIKGEEGYARSTDCVLTELYTNDGERRSDWNTSLDNMKLEFRINVLRDVGASQVVLYDNDTTIGVYDFDTNAHSIDLKYEGVGEDNRIELAYDVEHHLYAKYMGNKQCLKSQSKTYTFLEEMPDAYKCSLSLLESDGETSLGVNYDTGDAVAFKVKLEAETQVGQEYVAGNDIEVYVDGEKLDDDYTTDIGGITSLIEIGDLTDGKHTITARFNGTDYLAFSSASIDVSMGYLVTIESSPSYVINGSPSDITAKVVDYLNIPQPSFPVNIGEEDAWESIAQTEYTDSDGLAMFSPVYLSSKPFFAQTTHSSVNYQSVDYTTNAYNNVTVSLGANPTITSLNRGVTLTGKVNGVSEPVKVNVSGIGNLTTDNSGNFTTTYIGSCMGDVTITASVYGASNSVAIEDVYQYWKAPNSSMNMNYQIRNGRLSALSNGWRLTTYSDNEPCTITLNNPLDAGLTYSVEYDIVSVGGSNDKINYMTLDGITFVEISLKANDHIKMIYDCDNSSVKYYKNNTLITTSNLNSNTVKIMYTTDSDPYHYQPYVGQMTINNLKFKRLNQ